MRVVEKTDFTGRPSQEGLTGNQQNIPDKEYPPCKQIN
ncbi:hypothetical protein PHLH3_08420 [Pseudomonas sp. St386]|nr:hypothetical protein PHLH3_08420 [Pseudomonas sp. St386]